MHQTKSKNNDRISNHPIGKNSGISGRQMIYCMFNQPVRVDADGLLRRKSDAVGVDEKILAQR